MAERTCDIEGCGRLHVARGWCGMHYQRWTKYGDPLREPAGRRPQDDFPPDFQLALFCAAPGCVRPVRVQLYGWCGMHHARWLKAGDVQAHRPCRDDRRLDGWLWCSQCETHKAPGEFHRNRATKTGRDGVCRECLHRRWDGNRQHRRALARAYKAKNRDRVNEIARASYLRNPEKSNEAGRAWRKANPERTRMQIRAQNSARYARDKGAPGHCAPLQLAARWAYYGGNCWMCGAPATDTDHVKPLAGGGSNWPANLRPACRKCNRAKGGAWPFPLEVARARRAARGQAA